MALTDVTKILMNIDELSQEDEEEFQQLVDNLTRIVTSNGVADSSQSGVDVIDRIMQHLGKSVTDCQIRDVIRSVLAKRESRQDSFGHPIKEPSVPTRYVNLASKHLECLDDLKRALPGEKPKCKKPKGKFFFPGEFAIPEYIHWAVERDDIDALRLSSTMTKQNYVDFFQSLLWVEEAEQGIKMHRYDMQDVHLSKMGGLFGIQVPGLAEGRHSLMSGDRLLLRGAKGSTPYEGFVHQVLERDILVKLNKKFYEDGLDALGYEVVFLVSRTSFRRSHHAVLQFEQETGTPEILFPDPKEAAEMQPPAIDAYTDPKAMKCYNKRLNRFQRKAVINALKGVARPAPYILFGPPGTGKSVTLVEMILQAYVHQPRAKILICAKSNDCVDLLTEKILEFNVVDENHLVRLTAIYRTGGLIPPRLKKVTRDRSVISSDDYKDIRIVTTTCIQASTLNESDDKFDYVFIDEAGHASEPESLIAISLMKQDGCCVLAGDHQQLGPVCISKIAEEAGLGTSLLERLAKRSVYERQKRGEQMAYDERYLTKLIVSYRSDPRVLAVSNRLFYDDELKFEVKTPSKWMKLLKLETPMVFHSVKGVDRREGCSWFNPNEAMRCIQYVKKLYDAGLSPDKLGIITPYNGQIEKLDLLFRMSNLESCKIATMEKFQGDEREIIIITTVRSRKAHMKSDKKFNLGFLFNPKRFNVAVSRAKWVVIALGDPDILRQDENWQEYIKEAQWFEDPTPGQATGPRIVEF